MSATEQSRQHLHSRLRRVALRLTLRQFARATVRGVIWAGACGVLAVGLLVALPLLMGEALDLAAWVAAGIACVALIVGFLSAAAGTRLPGVSDAALSLQARLRDDDSAIATALQLRQGDYFEAPVLTRAGDALRKALEQPAPHVLRLRELLLAPVAALAVVTALVWAFESRPPVAASPASADRGSASAFSLDLPTGRVPDSGTTGRSTAIAALRDALRDAADALQSTDFNRANEALESARRAMADASSHDLQQAGQSLPSDVPNDMAGRRELAARIEAIADGLGGAEGGEGGTSDSGREGDQPSAMDNTVLVPFPKADRRQGGIAAEIALQSPQRRALAQRALELEESQSRQGR